MPRVAGVRGIEKEIQAREGGVGGEDARGGTYTVAS